MGRHSHFNVPPEHVTVVLLFQPRPPEFKTIMDNNHITARYIKDLAYCSVGSHSGTFQNPPIQELSLEACYALNVSHRKMSSERSDSRPHRCCCHVVVLVSLQKR